MGFISELASRKAMPRSPTDRGMGRAVWREVFGTDKESGGSTRTVRQSVAPSAPGGSWGRSSTSGRSSIERLVQAMRSNAPGGWSDDRWEQAARHYTGVPYVAIHRANELLTQAEFTVVMKDPDDPQEEIPATGEGAEKLIRLLEQPNDEESFGDLVSQTNLQMDLTGMALTWMVPGLQPSRHPNPLLAEGTPYELYNIPTAIAIPQPQVNPDFPDGYWRIQPVYPYGPFSTYPTPAAAVGAAIPAQWMMRIKYPHPILRYDGYSPLTALNLTLDEVTMMDRSRWYKMKKSINPSGVLNFTEMESGQPLPEEEVARIHAEWEQFQGPENHGNLIVGTPGSTLDEFGSSPRDMDYTGGWPQLVDFNMAGMGTNKGAAGMTDASSYSTLFANLKQLYWLNLEPKCTRIGQMLTRKLAPFFGSHLIVKVRCKPINDPELIKQKIDTMMAAKVGTKNDVLKLLDMPTTKEKWGDEVPGFEAQPAGASGMGMPGKPQPQAAPEQIQQPPEARDKESEQGRFAPSPAQSGGSLGPRKRLVLGKRTKSLYQQVREGCSGGNGHALNGSSRNGKH